MLRASASLAFALGLALLTVPAGASTGVVTEFSKGLAARDAPTGIVAGPDGAMWFTEYGSGRVGRITLSGAVTHFVRGIDQRSSPQDVTVGPDGNLWFTEYRTGRIGRLTPAGRATEFRAGISANAGPSSIVSAGDGNLWFTESAGRRIGRISSSGKVAEFPVKGDSTPTGITLGPGGPWFTEQGEKAPSTSWMTPGPPDRIGRITPGGQVTEFEGITVGGVVTEIAAGPDGNLWFTMRELGRIGRITPSGAVTEFSTGISPGARPVGIAAGPDGNLWFTDMNDRIGRITPSGKVTEFSAGITKGAIPRGIAMGPDGNMWFTEYYGGRIGRITTGAARPRATCAAKGASVTCTLRPAPVEGAPGRLARGTATVARAAFGAAGRVVFRAKAAPAAGAYRLTGGELTVGVRIG